MEVHTEPINSLSINATEDLALTSSTDKKLRLFDFKNNSLRFLYELSGHDSEIVRAIFIDGTDLIASADFTGHLVIWKLERKKYNRILKIKACEGALTSLAARSKNGIFVFCGCADGFIRTYKIDNKEEKISEIMAHDYGVTSLSSNDEYLISGGMNFETKIYENNKSIKTFNDHGNRINNVAICPSNKFNVFCFASCSDDKTVLIYVKENSEFKKQKIEIGEECYTLCFSKTGFCLTVGYGKNKFKAFIPDDNGNFKETEVVDIVN